MRIKFLGLLLVLVFSASFSESQIVSLSPSSLSFGNSPVKQASAPQPITLQNIGASTLTISSIQISGIYLSDFGQTNTCGSSVLAGNSCSITVTMTPQTIGVRTTNVVITDNAPGSPQSVALFGTGVHCVVIAWTASIGPGVLGYNVYRGTSAGGEGPTPLNGLLIVGTSYVDSTVVSGTKYYYVVKSIGSGSSSSPASNEPNAKLVTITPVVITTP